MLHQVIILKLSYYLLQAKHDYSMDWKRRPCKKFWILYIKWQSLARSEREFYIQEHIWFFTLPALQPPLQLGRAEHQTTKKMMRTNVLTKSDCFTSLSASMLLRQWERFQKLDNKTLHIKTNESSIQWSQSSQDIHKGTTKGWKMCCSMCLRKWRANKTWHSIY